MKLSTDKKMEPLKEFEANLGYHFSAKFNEALIKPYWIFFSLTHKCKFNCQMCGVKGILKEYELDSGDLKNILTEVAGWNSDCSVLFTGGETFLREDIFEIISSSVSLGLKTEIVTNGSQIISAEMASKIVKSGLANIAISLDGAIPQTHDSIRGHKGAYKKALAALKYLSEAKKIHSSAIQLSVWTTIMKENIAELYDIISLSKESGADCLVYHPVIVTQDDMQNTINDGIFWVQGEQLDMLKEQINKISEYQKQNGYIAFLHDPYLWLKYFEGRITKSEWKCNPFVFVDIGPDGCVRSCGPAFGNIKKMSLSDCLNTKDAKKARERMLKCDKPCLQTCWSRVESDSLSAMLDTFINRVNVLDVDMAYKKELLSSGLKSLTKYESLFTKKI